MPRSPEILLYVIFIKKLTDLGSKSRANHFFIYSMFSHCRYSRVSAYLIPLVLFDYHIIDTSVREYKGWIFDVNTSVNSVTCTRKFGPKQSIVFVYGIKLNAIHHRPY